MKKYIMGMLIVNPLLISMDITSFKAELLLVWHDSGEDSLTKADKRKQLAMMSKPDNAVFKATMKGAGERVSAAMTQAFHGLNGNYGRLRNAEAFLFDESPISKRDNDAHREWVLRPSQVKLLRALLGQTKRGHEVRARAQMPGQPLAEAGVVEQSEAMKSTVMAATMFWSWVVQLLAKGSKLTGLRPDAMAQKSIDHVNDPGFKDDADKAHKVRACLTSLESILLHGSPKVVVRGVAHLESTPCQRKGP